MRKKILLSTTAVVAVFAFAVTAEAGGRTAKDTRDAEIQELKARLDRLEQQQADDQRAAQDAAVQEQSRLLKLEKTPVTLANGRPCFNTSDNSFQACFRARVHFDDINYFQKAGDHDPLGSTHDWGNGSSFRRVYFGLEGKFFTDFEYEIRMQLGGDGVENQNANSTTGGNRLINIARIAYRGIPNFKLNVGAIEPLFTLEDSTSSADLLFLERASVDVVTIGNFGGDDARHGIEATFQKTGMFYSGDNIIATSAFTGGRTGIDHGTAGGRNDEQTQVLGRLVDRVYSDPDTNVQLGVDASHDFRFQQGAAGSESISFSDFPEARMDSTKLAATPSIKADSANLLGVEGGANWKNFFVSAEYYNWTVHASDGGFGGFTGHNPNFHGWYVNGSWVITGESKGYDAGHGSWGSPKPDHPFSWGGGWGAWEVAARYSELDLNWQDGCLGASPACDAPAWGIRGGDQQIATLGVNWYLNNNLKMQFDYSHVDFDVLKTSAGVNNQAGQTLNIFGTRVAFAL
jgi:phosphate-selective porin OprO/OprP